MSRAKVRAAEQDYSWFVEQEKKIAESVAEGRQLRAQMHRLFDPGHLYVVEYDSGVVKVGKADDVATRLEAHAKVGLVRSSWSSPRHLQQSKTERRLIAFCSERGTLHAGREYFRDISFGTARDYAAQVVHAVRCRDYLDALIEAVGGDMSKTVAEAHVAFEAELGKPVPPVPPEVGGSAA